MYKESQKDPTVFTPLFEAAWDKVHEARCAQQKSIPTNIAICGVSGVGKSTLIRTYKAQNPTIRSGANTHMPVVSFRVPSAPTVKSLLQAICRAFKGPDTGSGADLMKRATHYVDEFRVELLFADEAHHLIDRGRMKTHAQLGDAWKEFNDQVNCSICMCGASRLRLLFDTNTQLKNRWSDIFTMRPFAYDGDYEGLSQLVAALINDYGSKDLEEFLLQDDVLSRIQFATDGVPALIVKLTQGITRLNAPFEINMQTLDGLWNFPNTAKLPPRRRPFNTEFNFERLAGVDEPFYPSPFDGDNHAPFN